MSHRARLPQTPLPAIAEMRDGRFVVLVKCTAEAGLLFDTVAGQPLSLPLSEFEAQWSGSLILIASRATLTRRVGVDELSQAVSGSRMLFSMYELVDAPVRLTAVPHA